MSVSDGVNRGLEVPENVSAMKNNDVGASSLRFVRRAWLFDCPYPISSKLAHYG